MNRAISKMMENGLFNEQDVKTAVESGIQEAAPMIAENAANEAIQKTISPDNINKRVGLYKQSVANSIMSVGGAQ